MNHRPFFAILFLIFILASCQSELDKNVEHYRNSRDFKSLKRAVELVDVPTDTATVIKLLGPPISTGIDIRYFADSIGPNGCIVGAAFVLDVHGVITSKWVGELCE